MFDEIVVKIGLKWSLTTDSLIELFDHFAEHKCLEYKIIIKMIENTKVYNVVMVYFQVPWYSV